MASYTRDLVVAARTLLKARAFAAVCIISLGLGMSVVIAIFLLMRLVADTPPGVDRDGLVELVIRPAGALKAEAGGEVIDTWSSADYLGVRDAAAGVVVSGWSRGDGLYRPADGSPAMPLATVYVSSNYFATIGVGIPRGPGFTPADDAFRARAEVVISHRMWQVRFGSDPNLIGRPVAINESEYVVVGVAPEGFRGHVSGLDEAHYQLWLPLSYHPRLAGAESTRLDREARWIRVAGRLTPGTSVAQADARVHAAMAALAPRSPSGHQDKAGGVEPYTPAGARKRAQFGRARMMMLGLAGMVLLVVSLNISGMMLARSAIRERELAVRLAMGASRWRLVQHHLTEALVLALLGGSFASMLLFVGPVVLAWAFNMWGPALDLFRPDPWIALQCIALCFVTSLVLGALPAIRFSRPSIVGALKGDSAGSGRRVGRLQRLTAAAQAGIAVPFLVIAGVQLDQARVTAFADVGFKPQGLYVAQLNLSAITSTDEERQLFLRTVQENLAIAPGVASVSVGDGVPLDFNYRNTRVAPDGEASFVTAHTTRIGPGYLDTLGTRLLAGRAIDANDREGSERVVVLSEPLATQLFPSGGAIGQRIAFAVGESAKQTYTVVGISADLVSTQMGNPRPQLFLPLAQQPAAAVQVIARGTPSDASMRGAFENAMADALRVLSVQVPGTRPGDRATDGVFREFITGEGLMEQSQSDLLTGSAVGGAAAAIAMVLAALGVYGVIAFVVATRTREIGVRVALGASRGRVLRDVLGDALKLVVPGIGGGLLLAVAWVRLANPTWYPLGGIEPVVYSLAAATAFGAALLAGIPSARRAAAVHPMEAMRAE